nr:MATE family efflux transporter [uncultured Cetobacterium sp.]
MNVIMDYILIVIFSLGIKGAAFATGISQITTSSILLIYILKKSKKIKFIKIDNIIKNSLKIIYTGISEFLAEVSTGISIYLFNISILKFMGSNGVTAFGIISYITTFVTMAMIGFNQGLQPIVSFNLGKKDFVSIKKIFRIAILIVLITGFLFYSVINIFSENIIHSFIEDENVVLLTKSALFLYSLSYLISGLNIVSAGYFTAIKKVKQATIITALRGIILIFVFLYILPKIFGEVGLWLTVPSAELLTLILALIFLYKFRVGENYGNKKNKCDERIR